MSANTSAASRLPYAREPLSFLILSGLQETGRYRGVTLAAFFVSGRVTEECKLRDARHSLYVTCRVVGKAAKITLDSPSPWSRPVLEKLTVSQLFKLVTFMKPEGSLPCSQEPGTGLYPEPDESTPKHSVTQNMDHSKIYFLQSFRLKRVHCFQQCQPDTSNNSLTSSQ
jgi:hypothetical protein